MIPWLDLTGQKSRFLTISFRGNLLWDPNDLNLGFDGPIGLKFLEFTEHLERLFGISVDVLTPTGIQVIRNPSVAKHVQETIEYA